MGFLAFLRTIAVLLLVLGFTHVPTAFAMSRPDAVPPFLWTLFSHAAVEYQVPVNTLAAISSFESRFNPYACNFNGVAKYFSTKEEALWAVEEFRRMDFGVMFGKTAYYGDKDVILKRVAEHPDEMVTIVLGGKKKGPYSKEVALQKIGKFKGRSYDVGLMQINSYWINRFDIPISDLFDPRFNVRFGAWVLRQAFNDYGLGADGIGGYHTNPRNNPKRSLWYAKKILSSHKKLFGF